MIQKHSFFIASATSVSSRQRLLQPASEHKKTVDDLQKQSLINSVSTAHCCKLQLWLTVKSTHLQRYSTAPALLPAPFARFGRSFAVKYVKGIRGSDAASFRSAPGIAGRTRRFDTLYRNSVPLFR